MIEDFIFAWVGHQSPEIIISGLFQMWLVYLQIPAPFLLIFQ